MKTIITTASIALLLLGSTPLLAHHSFSMFDRSTQQVLDGTVERWAFNNPHTWLYMKVKNDDGSETLWGFEAAAPPQLIGRGITGNTLKPGDKVTIMYCPLLDKRPGGALGWVKVADGSFLIPSDGGCRTDESVVTQWKGWLEKGVRSNKEAL